jgi:predicted dehydrogenase
MKVLVAGLGGIGQRHVRNLHALLGDKVEFIAYRVRRLSQVLTDRMEIEAGADVETKFNMRVFTDIDEALAQRPELALICNPTRLHLSIALAVARAGCHLFLEKPLSDSLEGVAELMQVVEQRKLVALVGYQLRFHPCVQYVKTLLEGNAIGRVTAVRATNGEYLPGWHPYEDYRQSYAARADLGGGVILTQIHELDYLLWLFGFPRKLFAVGGHLSNLEMDVEDTASILMDCVVEGRSIPVHLQQDYIQRPPVRSCEIIGDGGKIVMDLRGLTVKVVGGGGLECEARSFEGFERNELFVSEMKHLLACLEGTETPLISLRDATRSLQMALAAKESIATGRVVDLADVVNGVA